MLMRSGFPHLPATHSGEPGVNGPGLGIREPAQREPAAAARAPISNPSFSQETARPVFCPTIPRKASIACPRACPRCACWWWTTTRRCARHAARSPPAWASFRSRRAACRRRWSVMRRQPVEMLLLDLKLPGGGGLKLLGEVKDPISEDRRGGDDRVCHRLLRGGGDAHRRGRLPDQAVCAGAADRPCSANRASRLHFDLESRRLRERLRTQRGMGNLIGTSPGDGEGLPHPRPRWRSPPIRC